MAARMKSFSVSPSAAGVQSDSFTRFAKAYSAEIRKDAAWRAAHQADLDRAREEFSACNLLQ